MEETKDTTQEEATPEVVEECPHCAAQAAEKADQDEMNLAILIALMPALTITLFSNLGLF